MIKCNKLSEFVKFDEYKWAEKNKKVFARMCPKCYSRTVFIALDDKYQTCQNCGSLCEIEWLPKIHLLDKNHKKH